MTSTADAGNDAMKLRAAQLRSMPLTRMLDYGMDYGDAVQLVEAPVTEPWDEAASRLAETQLARGRAAADKGNRETAVSCFRRATAALVFAQMAHNDDSAEKRTLYSAMSEAYQDAAELDEHLRVEKLRVPYRDGFCTAWLVRPPAAEENPTVLIVGGQSGWGPAFHHQAASLVDRGLSAVLLEAPGQGESRMFHGLHLDEHSHQAFSATVDLVRELTAADAPVGVWGNSFGGLLAARAAIHDDRFGACCVNGAPSRPLPVPFRTASEQSRALLGVNDDEQVEAKLRSMWIDTAAHRMSAPLLVLHGGRDPLINLEQQKPFLSLTYRSELRVWDDGEHTIYNHAAERSELVADWFGAQLVGAPS